MNILLTCAGRRNYLVEFFQRELGERGRVIACDRNAAAPALAAADEGITVPAMNAPDYFDSLLAICRERQIRLLISANDLELAGLARRAEDFLEAGTIPVISDPDVIATCQDKWCTFQFLRSLEIPTPATYLGLESVREALASGAAKFPIILKPRWGSSSIGLERIENDRELTLAYEWGNIQLRRSIFWALSEGDHENCLVFQEQLEGDEYGMDVVNDLDGNYFGTLARRKLVMRCGNTDRAVTVDDQQLDRLGQNLGRRLAHVGPLDCDVMMTDSGPQVLDLNPRIGGGYPFSHTAGANLPAALIAWANGEPAYPAWLSSQPGVIASRCDGILIVNSVESNARRLLC
jgi:carbamoyl-phosphate synthase large subunit